MSNPHDLKAGIDLGRVRALVGPVLSSRGVVLVDLEWVTDRSGWVLRLTLEREGAKGNEGVTLEDCAHVSRDVSAVLDAEEDLVPHRYNLEVSSPGIDRPLRALADFVRFAGESAKVKLARPAPDGQRVLRGVLLEASEASGASGASGGQVAMAVDGKRIEFAFADVAEANLVFELKARPKSSARGPGAKAASAKAPSAKGPRRERGARS
jgi:ribosome maturation factor RimP